MAEINSSNKKNNKKYSHKNIRVDLTPMVDLGFLLITFFILTTNMQQPHVMKLLLPNDSTDSTLLPQSLSLTFILQKHDSISYYDGFAKEIKSAGFGEMRSIIQQKQISLTKDHKNKNDLTLIIKPTAESSYKNFIDALDEVTINDCRDYFVADSKE